MYQIFLYKYICDFSFFDLYFLGSFVHFNDTKMYNT